MLDLSHATEISELWDSLESRAELPTSAEEFFVKLESKSGPKSAVEQRDFERHFLRCQAILRRDCEKHAIYIKDCSRAGMSLISPVQLFPRERIQLWMSPQRSYSLEVVRCQRVRANCYECGTNFLLK